MPGRSAPRGHPCWSQRHPHGGQKGEVPLRGVCVARPEHVVAVAGWLWVAPSLCQGEAASRRLWFPKGGCHLLGSR